MEVDEALGPAEGRGSQDPPPLQTGFYSLFFSSFQGGISQSEAAFTREGTACGVRADGRGLTELRPRKLACGLLPLSCSSAAIQTEENTVIVTVDAFCCVDDEPEALLMHQPCYFPYSGTLPIQNYNPTLSGAAEQELGDVTGGDGSTLSSLLQTMIEQLLLPHLKPIEEEGGGPKWRITIDLIVLKAGGCLLDVVSLAIWGALKTLRLPNVVLEEAEEKDQGLAVADLKVSCDERIAAGRPYPIETVPIILTAAQIGGRYVWDLTEVEAACGDSFLVAAFTPAGACVGLQKFGHVLCDCITLQTTLATSQRLSREIFEDLRRQCEEQKEGAMQSLDSFFTLASL